MPAGPQAVSAGEATVDPGLEATGPASTFYDKFAKDPTANYVPAGARRNVGTGVAVQNPFNLRNVPTSILEQIAAGSYGPESVTLNPSSFGSSLAFDPRFTEQINLNQNERPAHVYQSTYKDYMPTGSQAPRQTPRFFSPGFNPFDYTGVPQSYSNISNQVLSQLSRPAQTQPISQELEIPNTQRDVGTGVAVEDRLIPIERGEYKQPEERTEGQPPAATPISNFANLQSILAPYFSQPSVPSANFDTYTGYNPFTAGAVNPYIARMPQPQRPAALPMPGPEQPAMQSPTVQQNVTNPFVRSVGEGVAVDFGPSTLRQPDPTSFPYLLSYLRAYAKGGGVGSE